MDKKDKLSTRKKVEILRKMHLSTKLSTLSTVKTVDEKSGRIRQYETFVLLIFYQRSKKIKKEEERKIFIFLQNLRKKEENSGNNFEFTYIFFVNPLPPIPKIDIMNA